MISEVNSAMHEVIPKLKIIAEDNDDNISYRLCRMDFDIDARWKWCETIHNFYWHDATTTLGTSLGEAYHLLNSSLSRRNSGFLQGHANHASIIILLLGTTPHGNGKNNLYFFKKKNRWFQVSIKIAIEMDLDNDPHPYFH